MSRVIAGGIFECQFAASQLDVESIRLVPMRVTHKDHRSIGDRIFVCLRLQAKSCCACVPRLGFGCRCELWLDPDEKDTFDHSIRCTSLTNCLNCDFRFDLCSLSLLLTWTTLRALIYILNASRPNTAALLAMFLRHFSPLLLFPFALLSVADTVDIPSDTPIANLISSAKTALSRGAHFEALAYFDAAVIRDPSDYLTLFQRGATYLSLGRTKQANADFDQVLTLKPAFEGALIQRGKIRARSGDWTSAKEDYLAAGRKGVQDLAELEEAEGAAYLATEAEKKGDWETCINQAGTAILTAGTALSLRQLRVRCRLERGELQEAISDLGHVLQMRPGLSEPHLQISSMLFYSLNDPERGMTQIRKCLHSDPESKPCKTLLRREKAISKTLNQINSHVEKRHFTSAVKLLVGAGTEDDIGLLTEIQNDLTLAKEQGHIHPSAPSQLYATLLETACQSYTEMNSRKAETYCTQTLEIMPTSLWALLHKAQTQLDTDLFEAALQTLQAAKDNHPQSSQVHTKINEAQTLLKRSKQKDYYKALGLTRDADDKSIKRAYRKLTKLHHPDKAVGRGDMTKEQAEQKMAAINEAYEVLSDPDLKARFDRGEDPNDPLARQGGNPFQGSPFGAPGGGQQFFFQQGGGGGGPTFKFQAGGGGGFPGGFPFG